MIRVSHILYGAAIPRDTLATLVKSPNAAFPLAFVVLPTDDGSPRLYRNIAVCPDAVVVLLESAPAPGQEEATVVARVEERARQCGTSVGDMWATLERIYACYTLIDIGPAVTNNKAYRRVLGTEILVGEMGAGTQYVTMTLRKRDAIGDPHGAVIPREKHSDLAQVFVPLSGTARGYVELHEFGRLIPLIPGKSIVRVPPNVTHTVYLNYGTGDEDDLHVLSIYTSAQHGEHIVQYERPLAEKEEEY